MSGLGFGASAAACPTDQATILDAVVAKIRNDVESFANDQTCFISDALDPSVENMEPVFCTVCPTDGAFDEGEPDGGGPYQILESGGIRVTIWAKTLLDQLEHSEMQFQDAIRGLLILKKAVLKSLAGQMLYSQAGNQLLTECLRPLHASHPPGKQAEGEFSSVSITFEGRFYWDLT